MTSSERDTSPFGLIWEKVIRHISETVLIGSDPAFAEFCSLQLRPTKEWRAEFYAEYLRLRERLKGICYGPSDCRSPEEQLDGRKIAAVLCSALISQKGFLFNTLKAEEYAKRKKKELAQKPVVFNQWAVGNVYINYKLAYYASLQLVYLTLMRDLLVKAGLNEPGMHRKPQADLTLEEQAEREESRFLARALNQMGHLAPYPRPQPSRGDSFDVNIIIGLARTDMSATDLDMFLFAMQLYQIEEHTVDVLKKSLLSNKENRPS